MAKLNPNVYKPYEHWQKPSFLEHKDFKNIFYDYELDTIRRDIKHAMDALKHIETRCARHETVQLAKSTFDYLEQRDAYLRAPHLYYDFRCADIRVCIARVRNGYYVNVCGFNVSSILRKKYENQFGYGLTETIEEIIPVFADIVREVILEHLHALF